MALINCKDCNNQISSTAKLCPNCGFNQKQDNANKGCGILIIIYIIIFIVIAAIFVLGSK